MCAGTYSITIYCGYSLDFIIGYFKTFSNAIFNFDSYRVSTCFGSDNSKTSISSIVWLILMILLLQILKHFLLLLQLLILRLLVTLLLDFIPIVRGCLPIVRGYLRGPPYTTAPPCNAWGNTPVDDSWRMIFRIRTAIFHRDVAVTISITSRLSPLDSMDLIKININFEPHDPKVNRIYLMNTMINAPEVKKMSAIVLNAIAVLKDTEDYQDRYLIDCNDLEGNTIERLFIGKKIFDKIDGLVGKIIDVVYKDCIADVTQYIDDEDINEEVKFHTTTHKQVVDVVKTNDINLLIACAKHGIKDMYNELKELNK